MIGIMQPYFFPYIGYFQLIQAVDSYVNLDHVSFMKRSYMTRNQLKNNIPINISVLRASQNEICKNTIITSPTKWYDKFYLSCQIEDLFVNKTVDKINQLPIRIIETRNVCKDCILLIVKLKMR